jgi:hypothetical protein
MLLFVYCVVRLPFLEVGLILCRTFLLGGRLGFGHGSSMHLCNTIFFVERSPFLLCIFVVLFCK